MGPLALLALLGFAVAIPIFADGNDDDTPDPETPDVPDTPDIPDTPDVPDVPDTPDVPDVPDEPVIQGLDLEITQPGTYLGTEGADTITIPDISPDTVRGVVLDTGAGNDTIQGSGAFIDLSESTIDAGAGDDVVDLDMDRAVINGGDGNDTITSRGFSTNVNGGAGDDSIIAGANSGDVVIADGGDGNDTLRSGGENTRLSGGAGNDVIYISGPGFSETGYAETAFGDAGDDTIFMTNNPTVMSMYGPTSPNGSPFATGGEGADTFAIQTQDVPTGETEPDDSISTAAFTIRDFEPGVDQLSVDADAVSDGGVLASARLEEVTDSQDNPLTRLILTYENDSEEINTAAVVLQGATGVTWDDVEFLGDQMPVLTPLA